MNFIKLLIISFSLLSCFLHAEDIKKPVSSFSNSFTLASDYVFRGESETDDSQIPAVQFSSTWTHKSAWYTGIFASSNRFSSAPDVDSVIGPYLGKSDKIANTDFNYNIFIFHYMYPGVSDLNYTELWLKINKKFSKIDMGIEVTPTLNDWFGVPDWRGINYAFHTKYPLNESFSLSASFGYQKLTGEGAQGWQHWNLGIAKTYKAFTFDIRYHDSNINSSHKVYGHPAGLKIFNGRVVLGITVHF